MGQIVRVKGWPRLWKVWHHWRLTTPARDSMMQLTGQNRFTRSLSGGYKMTNGSHVRKLFFKNGRRSHQKKHSSWVKGNSLSRVEDGKWWWRMVSIRSSAMSDVFVVLFTFLAHFQLVICKSDPCSPYLHVLALTCPLVILPPRPLQIFV